VSRLISTLVLMFLGAAIIGPDGIVVGVMLLAGYSRKEGPGHFVGTNLTPSLPAAVAPLVLQARHSLADRNEFRRDFRSVRLVPARRLGINLHSHDGRRRRP
jgi:hypothetical protein